MVKRKNNILLKIVIIFLLLFLSIIIRKSYFIYKQSPIASNELHKLSHNFESIPSPVSDTNYISYTTFRNNISSYITSDGTKIGGIDSLYIRFDSAEELYYFSQDVCVNPLVFSGTVKFNHDQIYSILSLKFVLGDDIDYSTMGSRIMYPIGYDLMTSEGQKRAVFRGIFDGRGFEISNLTLGGYNNVVYDEGGAGVDIATTKYLSMFTQNEGTIKNFGLINPSLELLVAHEEITKTANIVGLNLPSGVVDQVYIIDNRTTISGSGIRMRSFEGMTEEYRAAGIVYKNQGTFKSSYIVTKTVVYSNYSSLFKVQPLYYENTGTINNVVYEDSYALSFLIDGSTYYVQTPINGTKASKSELENNKLQGSPANENLLSGNWYTYPLDRYPALFSLNYSDGSYQINNAIDLVIMSKLISLNNTTTYQSASYVLTSDIYMNQVSKSAYKTPSKIFTGSFGGPENIYRVINNLTINGRRYINNEYHAGLFSVSGGQNSVIKNVIFSGAKLAINDTNVNSGTISNYGIIAGTKTEGTIQQVLVNGNLDLGTKTIGETNVGLLVGKAAGTINEVYTEGTLEGNSHSFTGTYTITPIYRVGGIIGTNNNTGALIFNNSQSKANIKGIGTSSDVTSSAPISIRIGGLIGNTNRISTNTLTLTNNTFEGNISLRNYLHNNVSQNVAGIIGYSEGTTNITFSALINSEVNLNNLGHLDLDGTGNNLVNAAGGIISNNSFAPATFRNIMNYGTFTRTNYSNFKYTTLLLNLSTNGITLHNSCNYASIIWGGYEFSGVYDSTLTTTRTILNNVENRGNIIVEKRTLDSELKIAGFTTSPSPIRITSSSFQGIIRLSEIESSYPIFISAYKTIHNSDYIKNSSTFGEIIVAGVNTNANIYLAGFANIQNASIDNGINNLNITSQYTNDIFGISGKGNVYAGGISTFSGSTVDYMINTGNILLLNKSDANLTDLAFSKTSTHFNKFVQKSTTIPGITQGVVASGLVAVAVNTTAKITNSTNDATIIGISKHYVRTAGALALNGLQEIKAGIVNITDYYATVNEANTAYIRGVINYGNIAAVSTTIGDYTLADKPPVYASAGGILGYGILHINNAGAINHGEISSTDVAGGIVGTVAQSTSGSNTSTVFCNIHNYGDVRAIDISNSINLTSNSFMYSNLAFYTFNDPFIYPLNNYDATKRGIGGIFGRMQYSSAQYLNSNASNTWRFKIILNLNENVDFIGHIDYPSSSVGTNAGTLRTNAGHIAYSAKSSDTTSTYFNRLLTNNPQSLIEDYENRIFGDNNVTSRSAIYVRYVPYEVINPRFLNNPKYTNGMYAISDNNGFNNINGSFINLDFLRDSIYFGTNYDTSTEMENLVSETKAKISAQNQVTYHTLAHTIYGSEMTFTDSGPLYIAQKTKEKTINVNYDILNNEYEIELSLNYLDEGLSDISFYISSGSFNRNTLIARRYADTTGLANQEAYRNALMQAYSSAAGGTILTGTYSPLLSLDLTQFANLEEDTTVTVGYFVVYSEAAIFNSTIFADGDYQQIYTVKALIKHRQEVDSPVLVSYKIGDEELQDVTPIYPETHKDYTIIDPLENSFTVVLYFSDVVQEIPLGITLNVNNVKLEFYNTINQTYVDVPTTYWSRTFSGISEDSGTGERTFTLTVTLTASLQKGNYRILYKFHNNDTQRYAHINYPNTTLSNLNNITAIAVRNQASTSTIVDKTITTYINYNLKLVLNYVSGTTTGEITRGETMTGPTQVYLHSQTYSYNLNQTNYLSTLTRANNYVQLVSITNLNYPNEANIDSQTKLRTFNFKYVLKAQNGELTEYSHVIIERPASLTSLYKDNNNIINYETADLFVAREAEVTHYQLIYDVLNTSVYYSFYTNTPDISSANYLTLDIVGVNDEGFVSTDGISWTIDSNSNSINIYFDYDVISAMYTFTIKHVRHNGSTLTLTTLNIYKQLGLDAYLTNIKFSHNTDDFAYANVNEANNIGEIIIDSSYNLGVTFTGIFYDDSKNQVFNYRIDGTVASIPLDNYAPVLVDYLPFGATISRLAYDSNGNPYWTEPVSKDDPLSARYRLNADFTVIQSTGQEAEENQDIIVTYKVMSEERSEDRKVDVYYHITVVDVNYNINFIFDIYHRTGSEGNYTDTLIENSSLLKGVVIRINLSNFNTNIPVGSVPIPIVSNFPAFSSITSFNQSINQFYVGIDSSLRNRFGRNVSGYYAIHVELKDPAISKIYTYTITFNNQELNDLASFGVEGKYFYINGGTTPKTRRLNIFIYEADKVYNSWGLVDKYKTFKK